MWILLLSVGSPQLTRAAQNQTQDSSRQEEGPSVSESKYL